MAKLLLYVVALATLCMALEGVEAGRSNLKVHDAYSGIEAEAFDYIENAEVAPSTDPDDTGANPQDVTSINQASVLSYYNIDFGFGANRIELRLGQLAVTTPSRAGVVNVHLNSVDDEPFVSAIIAYGQEYQYVTISQFLNPLPSQVQNVTFTFESDVADSYLLNLNSFRFYSGFD